MLLTGCGQGSHSGRGQDGAADLGRSVGPDGQSNPEVGASPDSAPDRVSTIDRGSGPDQAADIGTVSDLATDGATGSDLVADLNAAADLAADRATTTDSAGADAGSAATDLAVEGPGPDGLTESGCALADNISIGNLPPISFAAYHDEPQIESYLQAVAAAFPAIATYMVNGQSVQGRDIPYLIINATCQASPPAIFTNGTHHGDEPSSTESVLAIPDYLLRNSATDSSVRSLLETYAFYVLPLVNPDGFALDTRYNADGLDINREYSYPLRSDADSFQTVEAQHMKSLQESVGFHAAIAYHSGAEEVLWPWCYTGDATVDAGFFTAAGQQTAQAMSFTVFQQSYDDYPTQGEYIDFAYWKSNTLAATFEVSMDKAPSVALLAGVVDGALKGTLAWVQAVSDHDNGSLHAVPAVRLRFPLTAPFDGTNRLE
ncbi:MAG: M14 family zinc carboxypeptidase [Polyangia bacterium]